MEAVSDQWNGCRLWMWKKGLQDKECKLLLDAGKDTETNFLLETLETMQPANDLVLPN